MLDALRDRRLDLLFLIVAGGVFALAAWYIPTADGIISPGGESAGAACWFRHLTGLLCPFCGMTRSFVHLTHGHLAAAFHWHPAGPLMAAWTVGVGVWIVLAAARRKEAVTNRASAASSLGIVVWACMLTGLARAVSQALLP